MLARTRAFVVALTLGALDGADAADVERPKDEEAPEVKPLPAGLTPAQVFRSGEELITGNSGEANGWSRAAVEAGIARVEKSLADGFRDRAAAYRALSQGYNAMWSRYELDAGERARYRRLEAEAAKKAWELSADPRWGMNWALNLTDAKENLAACRAVAAKHPRHAPARLALAIALCRQGPNGEGLKHLLAGIADLRQDEVDIRRSELTSQGFQCGGGPGFAAVEKAIAARTTK